MAIRSKHVVLILAELNSKKFRFYSQLILNYLEVPIPS